jgi:hypothetical protein
MTVRAAYIEAIECLREHGGDTKNAKAAIKILERKAEKLRIRAETAAGGNAEFLVVAEKKYSELPPERILEIRANYEGTFCAGCSGTKQRRFGFCVRKCWPAVPPRIRFAMHRLGMGEGWEGAYELGLLFLLLERKDQ